MRSDPFMRAISRISEAALTPDLWPQVLEALAEGLGAVGAAYILSNKPTEQVDRASFWGPSVELKADYVSHYAALDPFRAMLHHAAPSGSWLQLSKCLPRAVLGSDEWYNDFVVKCGVGDILGTQLFGSSSDAVIFGIHYGLYQTQSTSMNSARLRELFEPLSNAARLHAELREIGWKSAAALRALDQIAAGVIISDGDGRVVEVNRAAEHILRRDDGLTVRQGKLCAQRVFDHEKLARAIAVAAKGKTAAAVGRMLVGRGGARVAYILTVAPLGVELAVYERPLAMILVADPDARSPSERDLAEFFGLSPAESRLAAALLSGKKLREVAADSGVQITTLRTQLSSVLRKVGVSRQAELIRVLSNIPVPAARPEGK
jgi:DNA-binding CsgD family transcriptional regulator/PAS domain-containing protein